MTVGLFLPRPAQAPTPLATSSRTGSSPTTAPRRRPPTRPPAPPPTASMLRRRQVRPLAPGARASHVGSASQAPAAPCSQAARLLCWRPCLISLPRPCLPENVLSTAVTHPAPLPPLLQATLPRPRSRCRPRPTRPPRLTRPRWSKRQVPLELVAMNAGSSRWEAHSSGLSCSQARRRSLSYGLS